MSLYNQLFGYDPNAVKLLKILDIDSRKIPRFRDCFLTMQNNQLLIVIHTRTGGGNRAHYEAPNKDNMCGPWNCDLRKHPNFIRDIDCKHDSTFANFQYSVPSEYFDELFNLHMKKPSMTPEEKWDDLNKQMNAGEGPIFEHALDVGRKILAPVIEHLEKKS